MRVFGYRNPTASIVKQQQHARAEIPDLMLATPGRQPQTGPLTDYTKIFLVPVSQLVIL
jgi:hypothetical protein